jgi:hypothetical protein
VTARDPDAPVPSAEKHRAPSHPVPPHPSTGASADAHPVPTHPAAGRPPGTHPVLGRTTPTGTGWLSRRLAARAQRRVLSGRRRVVQRVELLGPEWRIVDYHPEDPDFLAIGPGGLFQVTVCDHGRSRVQLAGDVVQVNGRRPPYVALARRDAQRISQQMSRLAGRRIPVIPVVAFLGTGEIVYYGRPPEGCIVTSYRDIGRALGAHGQRVGRPTIEKLVELAQLVDSATVGQYLAP